uniref:Candidate secreted effector n=1 Tax=Meloidogyne incognita TaxID=6306 RepID=A0A914M731_MELIC
MHNSLRIISIYMKYRRAHNTSSICTIWRGTRRTRIGSKSNLIIYYNMNGSMNCIITQIVQVESFHNNALSRERSISMQYQRL